MQELNLYPHDAWEVLSPRLSRERKQKMEKVASQRTNYLRLIIQDVHNQHNISACLRSAEAFGIQNVHVVSLDHTFKVSGAARGVKNWLSIHQHDSIEECASTLHHLGFDIAAGMPAQNSVSLEDMKLEKPLAVLFGNEHAGVSPQWEQHIDCYFTIPMSGVVESLNISVSAAITMQHMSQKAKTRGEAFFLNADEQNALLGHWVCKHIPRWELEYKHYKSKLASNVR